MFASPAYARRRVGYPASSLIPTCCLSPPAWLLGMLSDNLLLMRTCREGVGLCLSADSISASDPEERRGGQ
ncbi:hypothetical protein KCP75_12020 [Salmonella enterica subsp. enterica]|nr:hypothetical protein KCP75_12020 [Salmonella enterica subsp. enterica]